MSEKPDEYGADSPAIDPPNNLPEQDLSGEYDDGAIDPPNNDGGGEPPQ